MDKGNKNLNQTDNEDYLAGQTKEKVWWQPAIVMFARLSGLIVIPVILGVFIGKWLDKKFNSEPWLFLACVGFAFIISMFGLVKKLLKNMQKLKKKIKI
ncbi:MAG: AtpZ/AtpI family protein [Patescibacteria group bacterium]